MKKINLKELGLTENQKLTREQLQSLVGASGAGSTFCYFTYDGTLWAPDMKITQCGQGKCPDGVSKCYNHFQTSNDCSC